MRLQICLYSVTFFKWDTENKYISFKGIITNSDATVCFETQFLVWNIKKLLKVIIHYIVNERSSGLRRSDLIQSKFGVVGSNPSHGYFSKYFLAILMIFRIFNRCECFYCALWLVVYINEICGHIYSTYEGWSDIQRKSVIQSHSLYLLQWKFIDINYHS